MTTTAKLVDINAWVVVGAIPTNIFVSGAQVANCVNWSEFTALSTGQQLQLLTLCAVGGQGSGLLGGSTNTALLTDGMILAFFPSSSKTIANLTALAQGAQTPWWQVSTANGGGGLSSPVGPGDLIAAGGLS
jgi:hypothetical protein